MATRKKFIAANWKMNLTRSLAASLAREIAAGSASFTDRVDVAICPPFVYLSTVAEALVGSRVALGAQNLHPESAGAFTGQISPAMLTDLCCHYVIIGHSETRHTIDRGESDAFLNAKLKAALAAGLTPIFCVGETLQQRDANQTDQVNRQQLTAGLAGISPEQACTLVIAYEPVWAIGTGRNATPQQAQDAHAAIRAVLADLFNADVASTIRIQYGGSVKPANAAEIFQQPDVDGGLIGGASLKAQDFLPIVQAAC